MKTNISGLMNTISEYDKKINMLNDMINNNIYSVSIEELNGTINVIEDLKDEFKSNLSEYKKLLQDIVKLKEILYEKNNTYKLTDGRTIQSAIIDNTNLRKLKSMYENLILYNNSKRRVTEVNNSYFECRSINYDKKKILKELDEINKKIQDTDFQISKLNSKEFNIEL